MEQVIQNNLVEIELNGDKLLVSAEKTILEVAEAKGIDIPTLCHDPRLEPYGSCWICMVRVEGAKGFVPACATKVSQGMRITTEDAEIRSVRRMALDLLLSGHYGDCKAPCALTCPAGIDVQGYIGLIANRRYEESLRLIKEKNPFPAAIGRVCPRPCEEACRRNLVDEPVAIDWLKRFAADRDLFSDQSYDPPLAPKTGKRVAVVGAGPAGLSAAYYLVREGVEVTVLEAEEKPGGMFRYGIPDYRLSQDALDREIETILRLGVELKTGVRLGRDLSLDDLRSDYDAVILAIGAWKSRAMRIPGEEHPGVLAGIDFLREVALGRKVPLGRRIAVIGGGNTAIDAARTSLRLGAEEVYIFYRRTRKEMPASDMEIEEALEEGVKISYLVAPVEVIGGKEALEKVRLIRMELGEPDASGRRRPLPIEGSEFDQEVDNIIAAIGQYADTRHLEETEGLTDERSYIVCDPETGETPLSGVFAAGDLVTGPDIAIRAIAGGRLAAVSVQAYLEGRKPEVKKEFLSRKEDFGEISAEEYREEPRIPREKVRLLPPQKRIQSFEEIEEAYTEEQALKEAARCLECGCQDLHECKLKRYAEAYGAEPTRFKGEIIKHPIDETHPYIQRDPAKCILCGRCIRICLDVQGIGVLGYINRGFRSLVAPSFNLPYGEDSLCISCGQCVSACPVGALTEKLPEGKTVPLVERSEEGFCSLCSVACPVEYRHHGSLMTRVVERFVDGYGGRLCKKGKFEQGFLDRPFDEVPRAPEGGPLTTDQALERLEDELKRASKPLLRLSPLLAGEAIDRFLDLARSRSLDVEPLGLQGLERGWGELAGPADGDYLFEDRQMDLARRVLLLVGNLEESNNVAFTECLARRRQGLCELWAAGREPSIYDHWFDRIVSGPGDLEKLLERHPVGKERVDILLNPQEVLKLWGKPGEKSLISSLRAAGGKEGVRITLFWNARNAGYLLRSLSGLELRGKKEKYDLVLEVGVEPEELEADMRAVHWGRSAAAGRLFIPLPRPVWISGYSEPSGRPPFQAGALDRRLLRSLLPG